MLTKSLPGSSTIDLDLDAPAGDALVDTLRELPSVERVEASQASVRLYLDTDPATRIAQVAGIVAAHDAALLDLNFGRASLEDVGPRSA